MPKKWAELAKWTPNMDLAALCTSFTENNDRARLALMTLAMLLYKAMREHPSRDMWALIQASTVAELETLGFAKDAVNSVFKELAKISAVAESTSPWPKGFF